MALAATQRSASEAVAKAVRYTTYMPPAMCLNYVWNLLDAPRSAGLYDANAAWAAATQKVTTGTPPAGAPVYFAGYKHGHIAISIGNGWVRSTDVPGLGRVGNINIADLCRSWGITYRGWSRDYAGRPIPGLEYVPPKAPSRKPGRAPDKARNGLTVRASNLDQNDTKTRNNPVNNDIRQLAEYVWKAQGASYKKAHGAAWAKESRDFFGPELSKGIRALYAALHAQYPKDDRWFTVPSDSSSSPAWGGPEFLKWLGFDVI